MQEGRARGNPAPERSTRLPPSSGQSSHQIWGRAGLQDWPPQLSSSQTTGCKRLIAFPKMPPQSWKCGLFLSWKQTKAAQVTSIHSRKHERQYQRPEGGLCVVLTYRGKQSGKEERGRGREGCSCDQGEGHIATSHSQSELRKSQESRGSSSEALPSECQSQHVLTWGDRLMEESQQRLSLFKVFPPALGTMGGSFTFSLSPIPRRITVLESLNRSHYS